MSAAALIVAACGGSSASSGRPGSALKTSTIHGATVLTSAKGFTLYSFAPDTPAESNCNGPCAKLWPPVKGPVTGSGIKGTFGTIKRSDGSTQATFDGHPLYTYVGDKSPGQARGNGLNAADWVWHEITTSGTAASAGNSPPGRSGGHGYRAGHRHPGAGSRRIISLDASTRSSDVNEPRINVDHFYHRPYTTWSACRSRAQSRARKYQATRFRPRSPPAPSPGPAT